MKVLSTAAITLFAGSSSTTGFAPSASKAAVSNRISAGDRTCGASSSSSCLSMALPFFAQEEEKSAPAPAAPATAEVDNAVIAEALADAEKRRAEEAELDALSMEEEVELLVQKELGKTKRMSNLRNEKGVEYAPWMGISEVDENKIRNLMRDRTEARRRRQEQERDVSGNLFRDSQAQELSGTGLSYKIIDGEVELTWATKTESDTKGFIVKRRAAKTNDYSVVASYADFGPLASKGREGGVYRYLDSTVSPGGWVYRISEEDNAGNEADVCQCLVEVETEDEQKAALIAGVGFGVFAVLAVVAGIAIDPMNGY
eukprot:CAMPEP_0172535764 /NCGR_PEP_ID=MMETSP1067-20121228/7621_1 /TAXON_ID=265564 ORGANISM="Thalassiosira punctigera, Strain Tpunct2005C2" /NCGR_SAMPLE_ID=MMETSP1067 /ASSEMBLY_ACC=CAM_ASM_000444 /LENGTH=314 /DNA_ID=CAMNT_0013320709 /DNA_START=137 /DNA_END=1081 /DNA_ORIENTATION=+